MVYFLQHYSAHNNSPNRPSQSVGTGIEDRCKVLRSDSNHRNRRSQHAELQSIECKTRVFSRTLFLRRCTPKQLCQSSKVSQESTKKWQPMFSSFLLFKFLFQNHILLCLFYGVFFVLFITVRFEQSNNESASNNIGFSGSDRLKSLDSRKIPVNRRLKMELVKITWSGYFLIVYG